MTDKQLYRLCKKYGRRALEARRRFAGLLPEVLRRRLYEKKGCGSIYVFAFKLAGMTRDQVDTVLRLERRFEDKPVLHQALVSGEPSPNKLIRIASIATTENQRELFETAQKLSKQAIDVFVKDYRREKCVRQDSEVDWRGDKNGETNGQQCAENGAKNGQQDGLFKPENVRNSLPVQSFSQNHDFEILAKLSPEVKGKIKEMMDKGIDINKELLEFFKERESMIAREKNEIAKGMRGEQEVQIAQVSVAKNNASSAQAGKISRYIPAKIKKIIKKEYGSKCSKLECPKPAENLHHTRGFAIYKSHDPRTLRPLCRAHHEIEHISDKYVQKYRKFQ